MSKLKHQQVMKLCVMTEEDVFNDKTSTEEMMEIIAMQSLIKGFTLN